MIFRNRVFWLLRAARCTRFCDTFSLRYDDRAYRVTPSPRTTGRLSSLFLQEGSAAHVDVHRRGRPFVGFARSFEETEDDRLNQGLESRSIESLP